MSSSAPVPFAVGDTVTLRKAHPCGGREWQVLRVGADIGICCRTCGRRVVLSRENLERRSLRYLMGSPQEADHASRA